MLAKKYHAIAFLVILLMLLLLGLHLLGFGFGGSSQETSARAAALARPNSSQSASSSSPAGVVYKHPIAYDKLTGVTNNQINDILGAPKHQTLEFPLDHYQQHQQQQQQPHQHHQQLRLPQANSPFSQLPHDDFFLANHMHQPPLPVGMFPQTHRAQHPGAMMPPHPQLMPLGPPANMMTTAAPNHQGRQQPQSMSNLDSLPSASSVNNNGARPLANATAQSRSNSNQPIYYTPPIFAYNHNNNNNNNNPNDLLPPVGPPEAPISVDDYNNRMRLYTPPNQPNADLAGHQQPNLLADPRSQQRHKDQMLDRQLLMGNPLPPFIIGDQNQTSRYYPDSAVHRTNSNPSIIPPYAHQMSPQTRQQQISPQKQPSGIHRSNEHRPPLPGSMLRSSSSGQPHQDHSQTPPMVNSNLASDDAPTCARINRSPSSELFNASTNNQVTFCNEDADYPMREIMRAIETYAAESSIELLIPQQIIQMLVPSTRGENNANRNAELQRQYMLDPLQSNLSNISSNQQTGSGQKSTLDSEGAQTLFPSMNFESMCKSNIYMAQPRRVKNLQGRWKIIVNLPGHKYRGIAISQMVRVEECSRPNSECLASATTTSLLPRSRCLQHYDNQRLLAWSHQQGLHLDVFRMPSTCSCHIRR